MSQTPALPEGYEYCTTEAKRKRHISNHLAPHTRSRGAVKGRRGRTLCGNYGEDQVRVDYWADLYGMGRKRVVVADLPLCALCPKSLPVVKA